MWHVIDYGTVVTNEFRVWYNLSQQLMWSLGCDRFWEQYLLMGIQFNGFWDSSYWWVKNAVSSVKKMSFWKVKILTLKVLYYFKDTQCFLLGAGLVWTFSCWSVHAMSDVLRSTQAWQRLGSHRCSGRDKDRSSVQELLLQLQEKVQSWSHSWGAQRPGQDADSVFLNFVFNCPKNSFACKRV